MSRLRATEPSVRAAWLARAIGAVMAAYVRLLVWTCRFEGGLTADTAVLAFWHEANLTGMVAALRWRGDLPHASFSTRGFRGVVITSLLERIGILVVPLPEETDRAGARSLSMTLARLATDGYSLAVTPDGPFGPRRVGKPGALFIARAAGLPIVPVAPGARPAVRLRRWDRHILPLPFARLWVLAGDEIRVDRRTRIGGEQVDLLTQRLSAVAEATDRRMAGGARR